VSGDTAETRKPKPGEIASLSLAMTVKAPQFVIARKPLAVLSLPKDGDLERFDYWPARLLRYRSQ
jgi:hypothetical protein